MSSVKLSALEQVQFGTWRLSPKSQTITDGEVSKELEPLIYSLLVYLLENHGRIVPKSELVDYVWRQKYVDDNAINRAFSVLRKTLKSENQRAIIVKTHYRKGYSIIVPVEFISVADIQQESLRKAPELELLSNTKPRNNVDKPYSKKKKSWLKPMAGFAIFLVGVIATFFMLTEPFSAKEEREKKLKGEVLTWREGSVAVPRLSQGEALLAYTHMAKGNNKGALIVKSLISGKEWEIYTPSIVDEQAFPMAWYQDSIVYFQVVNYRTEEKCAIWQADISPLVKGISDSVKPQKLFDCKSANVMQGDIVEHGKSLIYTKHYYRNVRRIGRLISIDLSTGEEFQISTPPMDAIGDYYVKANGKQDRIAYLRSTGASTQVMLSKLDGSGLKELMMVNYKISAFTWSEDDTELNWLKAGTRSLVTLNVHSLVLSERDIDLENSSQFTNTSYLIDLFRNLRVVLANEDRERTLKRYKITPSELIPLPFIELPDEELAAGPLTNKAEYIFLSRNMDMEYQVWRYNLGVVKNIGTLQHNWAKEFGVSPNKQQIVVYEHDLKMDYQINIYDLEPFKKVHTLKLPGLLYSVDWLNKKELVVTYLNTDSKVVLARYNILNKMLITEDNDCFCFGGISVDSGQLYTVSAHKKLYKYNFEQKSHQALKQLEQESWYDFMIDNGLLYITTLDTVELHSLSNDFEPIIYSHQSELEFYYLYKGFSENEFFVNAVRFKNNNFYLFDLLQP
jgi:DNA-binding winged helix-turn-helix (wHTH) protein